MKEDLYLVSIAILYGIIAGIVVFVAWRETVTKKRQNSANEPEED